MQNIPARNKGVQPEGRFERYVSIAIFSLVLIIVPLGFATQDFAQINNLKIKLKEILHEHVKDKMNIHRLRVTTEGDVLLVEASVDAFVDIYKSDLERAQELLSKEIGAPVHIRLSVRRAELFDLAPNSGKTSNKLLDMSTSVD